MKEEEALKAIEAKLEAMTTDDYEWGDSYETKDITGTYVDYHCVHDNGSYKFTKNFDKGRRTREYVGVDIDIDIGLYKGEHASVNGAYFIRRYGERNKQWYGNMIRHIDWQYGYDEDVRINLTDAMIKALDKISKIHSK